MKRLLILIGLIGIVHVTSGLSNTSELKKSKTASLEREGTENLRMVSEPVFTELNGNIFLAIKVNETIDVEDGDPVQFVFDRKTKLVSFHINDINQDLIDKGEANLFVMIHHDLALELRAKRLKKVIVKSRGKDYSVLVNSYWTPDHYLAVK